MLVQTYLNDLPQETLFRIAVPSEWLFNKTVRNGGFLKILLIPRNLLKIVGKSSGTSGAGVAVG